MLVDVAVVGAGFSGIGAAAALRRAGFDDLVLIEEGDGVGGAWHWNTYPGIGVDIPSFSYQFSYRQRPDWSRVYAPGNELKAYAEDCVDRFGLRSKLRLNTLVDRARWDEDADVWRLAVAGTGEELAARHIVGATGVLTKPKPPDIAGLESFAGATVHTARWDHGLDLRGKRVALIGTGASAVQVVPTIAPLVDRLTVFQRTPIWCLPKLDGPVPTAMRRALRLPGARWTARALSQAFVELTFPLAAHYASVFPMARWSKGIALKHLRDQVEDPEVRAKLTPQYDLGCKRPGFSNDYLRAFNRDNVALETAPIARITEDSVVTADGARGPFDVLVLATGFKVFEPGNMPPYPVTGVGGLDLEAFWAEHRFQAYQGVSVPGFPNMFMILGPYGYNGASYFTLIESQSRHIVRCLKRARQLGATRVEVTREANERYLRQMLGRRHRQVFFQGGCATANSYYFDAHGDAPFRASPTFEVMWRSARFPLNAYDFASAR